jgi:hypothetical protein
MMAHYAYLDDNNLVIAVTVGKDETELIDGLDTETYYSKNTEYKVKRTSYNAATNGFRFNYAGIGYIYDAELDAFYPPKCHDEAELSNKCQWICANSSHVID